MRGCCERRRARSIPRGRRKGGGAECKGGNQTSIAFFIRLASSHPPAKVTGFVVLVYPQHWCYHKPTPDNVVSCTQTLGELSDARRGTAMQDERIEVLRWDLFIGALVLFLITRMLDKLH